MLKLELGFNDGIISGDIMRDVVEIFPEFESSFQQRKSYDEYYYSPMEVEVSLEQIEKLTEYYAVEISNGHLTIKS